MRERLVKSALCGWAQEKVNNHTHCAMFISGITTSAFTGYVVKSDLKTPFLFPCGLATLIPCLVPWSLPVNAELFEILRFAPLQKGNTLRGLEARCSLPHYELTQTSLPPVTISCLKGIWAASSWNGLPRFWFPSISKALQGGTTSIMTTSLPFALLHCWCKQMQCLPLKQEEGEL